MGFLIVVSIVLMTLQFLGVAIADKGTLTLLRNSLLAQSLENKGQGQKLSVKILEDFGSQEFQILMKQIEQYLKPGQGLISSFVDVQRAAFFMLEGRTVVYDFPFQRCNLGRLHFDELVGPPPDNGEKPLYITHAVKPSDPRFGLLMLFESQLDKVIREGNVGYTLISSRWNGLETYFDRQQSYQRLFSMSGLGTKNKFSYTFYRVAPQANDSRLYGRQKNKTIVNPGTRKAVQQLETIDPKRHAFFVQHYLMDVAHLTSKEIDFLFGPFD